MTLQISSIRKGDLITVGGETLQVSGVEHNYGSYGFFVYSKDADGNPTAISSTMLKELGAVIMRPRPDLPSGLGAIIEDEKHGILVRHFADRPNSNREWYGLPGHSSVEAISSKELMTHDAFKVLFHGWEGP